MRALCSILAIILFTASCHSTYKSLEYRDIKNVKMGQLGIKQSSLDFSLIVFNPNNYDIEIKNADLDIYIDGAYLGKINQDLKVTAQGMAESPLPFSIDLSMKNLLKNTLTTLFHDEIEVKVVGKLKAGRHGLYKNIEVNYIAKRKIR